MLSPATARSVTENAEVRGQSIPGHVKQTYARDLGSLSRTMISPGMTPTIRMTCGHIRRAAAIAYLHVTYSLCCTFPCGMRPSGRAQDQAITRYLADPSVKRLTPREHDVARLAAAGLKDIVIAQYPWRTTLRRTLPHRCWYLGHCLFFPAHRSGCWGIVFHSI